MKRILLTNTDLKVSQLSLGTVNYGSKTGEKEAFEQMDKYLASGGNFIDTASIYGCFEGSIEKHASEKIIGRWMKDRHTRDEIVISTKGGHPLAYDPDFTIRLHRDELFEDVEKSLSHLHTDYIDMYFLHRDDTLMSVGEIMETLEEIRRQGKIRYYGFSNWKIDRVKEAQAYAKAHDFQGFTVNQLMWSLAHVDAGEIQDKTLVAMDRETYAYHKETQMSAMAYRSIAKGYFTRREKGVQMRSDLVSAYSARLNDEIYALLANAKMETGASMAELSLMYFLSQPFPSVAIASFSTDEQLKEGLCVLTKDYDKDLLALLSNARHDLF